MLLHKCFEPVALNTKRLFIMGGEVMVGGWVGSAGSGVGGEGGGGRF